MEVFFATTNEGKVTEANEILKKVKLKILKEDVPEIKSIDEIETIVEKAKAAYKMFQKPLIVEDTCLFFSAFEGFPGTYTKFAVRTIGLETLLEMLNGKTRNAKFITCIAYIWGEEKFEVFQGIMEGKITENLRGVSKPGLPYDSVFIPNGFDKTYAELGDEIKNKISHRTKAFQNFEKWFEKKEK